MPKPILYQRDPLTNSEQRHLSESPEAGFALFVSKMLQSTNQTVISHQDLQFRSLRAPPFGEMSEKPDYEVGLSSAAICAVAVLWFSRKFPLRRPFAELPLRNVSVFVQSPGLVSFGVPTP
jgi:hypothetical protein